MCPVLEFEDLEVPSLMSNSPLEAAVRDSLASSMDENDVEVSSALRRRNVEADICAGDKYLPPQLIDGAPKVDEEEEEEERGGLLLLPLLLL